MTGAILAWLSPSQTGMEGDSLVKHTWLYNGCYYINMAELRCQEFEVQPVVLPTIVCRITLSCFWGKDSDTTSLCQKKKKAWLPSTHSLWYIAENSAPHTITLSELFDTVCKLHCVFVFWLCSSAILRSCGSRPQESALLSLPVL